MKVYYYERYNKPQAKLQALTDEDALEGLKEVYGDALVGFMVIYTENEDGSFKTIWME